MFDLYSYPYLGNKSIFTNFATHPSVEVGYGPVAAPLIL